MFYGLIFI